MNNLKERKGNDREVGVIGLSEWGKKKSTIRKGKEECVLDGKNGISNTEWLKCRKGINRKVCERSRCLLLGKLFELLQYCLKELLLVASLEYGEHPSLFPLP